MAPVTRRGLVTVGTSLFAGAWLLPGCDRLATSPDEEPAEADTEASLDDKEAPDLAARVKSGDLPPLEQRLPAEPLVVEPVDRPGAYGGTLRSALHGPEDSGWISCMVMAQDRLVRWNLEWDQIHPNVAESYEHNSEGTVYTFRLRPGMKWSDGEPFTPDDIIFWYEDIFLNEELTPVPTSNLVAGDEPVIIEKVDDHTVQFVFAEPNGLLLPWLAAYYSDFYLLPRHYLEQFHKTHNPDADALAEEEGFSNWVELFANKMDWWANPDLPRLHAWVPENTLGEGSRVLCQRNPYYFKVDSEGRQLPYTDTVAFDVVSNPETLLLKAQNGEFDIYFRYINTPANKPTLARNRDAGAYHFIEIKQPFLNTMTIHLNLTHQDPVKREIFQNKDFRIGLSYAMNRTQMIDTVFQRQGEPWQAAPRPEASFADEEMGRQYTEYDPDLANEHLDRAGYVDRDDDGIRLGPDGEPIRFAILSQTRYIEQIDALQLMRESWLAVGVDMRPQNVDTTLWNERVAAGDHDGCVDDGSPGYNGLMIDPRWLFANESGDRYAYLWANWFTGTEPNETPPAPMREQMEIWRNDVRGTADPEAQIDGMRRIVEIAKQEFWIMGVTLPPSRYGIVSDRLQNVPDVMWDLGRYPSPGPSNPAQYFVSE